MIKNGAFRLSIFLAIRPGKNREEKKMEKKSVKPIKKALKSIELWGKWMGSCTIKTQRLRRLIFGIDRK